MQIPRVLREQMREFIKAGFTPVEIEKRAGSHFMVKFAEIGGLWLVSQNEGNWRNIKNSIARFRQRLKQDQEENNEH